MTCNRCTRVLFDACVGELFCAAIDLSDEDACRLAADICLSWWQKRDEVAIVDDALWEMSEHRIDELACYPETARAYLAELEVELKSFIIAE
jgi:hypothetical protein